jgi:hypothetical protein
MEKINIAEILKDCPQGMELDCTLFEKPVKYTGLTEGEPYIITIKTPCGRDFYLTKEGYLYDMADSKCIIFPKGKTTWEGFVPPCKFNDGDIVATSSGQWIGITTGGVKHECIPTYCVIKSNGEFEAYIDRKKQWCFGRLATKEEKQKLFKAIKENGYRWDAEAKTLEKLIEPKFNVGGKIKRKGDTRLTTIKDIRDNYYIITIPDFFGNAYITDKLLFSNQNEYELVPDKFDITTLKPFDKVLVRDDDYHFWLAAIFSHYTKGAEDNYPYFASGSCFEKCVPYEGNEHLLGTTNDCDEYYKTWE